MIKDILILYWTFSVLFMIGFIDTEDRDIKTILIMYIINLLIAPIMFPVALGDYISRNS